MKNIADQRPGRVEAIDLARGVALIAMAVYHFAWDLEFFGYAERGMTAFGGWKLFARCIASSFLALVGISLVLAHVHGVRWRPFLRRFAAVAGAAVLISGVTYLAVPQGFIFFGILHQIALASLLGLLFLRLPALLTLVLAAGVIAAPFFLRHPMFNAPLLWWVGLSTEIPRSNDYVPLFPWFGAVLIGVAIGRLGLSSGLFARLASWRPQRWSAPLRLIGRHSLAFYLVHQPVLIGLVWLFAQVAPAAPVDRGAMFLESCGETCRESRDGAFCAAYCPCVLERVEAEGWTDAFFTGALDEAATARLRDFADQCAAETDGPGGSTP